MHQSPSDPPAPGPRPFLWRPSAPALGLILGAGLLVSATLTARGGPLILGLLVIGGLLVAEARRDRAIEDLREANARLRRLAEVAREGVILIENGRFLDVNEAYARMFGYRVEELIGRKVTELADPAWTPGIEARHAAEVGDPYEVPCLRKDGSRFTVWAVSQVIHRGERAIRISIVRDLTEERTRAQERQRLLDLLDASMDYIAIREVVTAEGGRLRSIYWNEAMYRLHGIPPGAPIPDLPVGADRPAWAAERLLKEALPTAAAQGHWAGEAAYFDASGREVPTSHHLFAIRDEQGRLTHYASIARDIRAEKEVERAKRDLVAMANHELRTPLTALLGAVRLLEGEAAGTLTAAGAGLVKVAIGNGERLLRLINDLLDLDKLEHGNALEVSRTCVDLASFLPGVVDLQRAYARPFGVALVLEASPPGLAVWADAHRLQQVLDNLLSNAAKFAPAGSEVHLRAVPDGEEVRISVADAGPGIPQAFRGRVFQPFEQAESTRALRTGGTGLGLAVSKRLVERMEGRIGFETEEGRGTTFSVVLKRAGAPSGTPDPMPH